MKEKLYTTWANNDTHPHVSRRILRFQFSLENMKSVREQNRPWNRQTGWKKNYGEHSLMTIHELQFFFSQNLKQIIRFSSNVHCLSLFFLFCQWDTRTVTWFFSFPLFSIKWMEIHFTYILIKKYTNKVGGIS